VFDSTKTTSKEIAKKIWKKREGEIALGLFKVGWPGERMTFCAMCDEFLLSHTSTLVYWFAAKPSDVFENP